MRFEKLTTAFQQALGDAGSAAVARDNPYIEPAHLLAAMLAQADGPKALLDRAGANTAALATAMETALRNLPTVQGGGQVQPGRELLQLLQAADKEASKAGDQFIASEMYLPLPMPRPTSAAWYAATASAAKPWRPPSSPCAAARSSTTPTPKVNARL